MTTKLYENALREDFLALLFKNFMFANLAHELKPVFTTDPEVEIAGTDGTSLYINVGPRGYFSYPVLIRKTILAHECLHPALLHNYRRGDRIPRLFNIAADYVANWLLKKFGFYIPDWFLYDERFANMSMEDVYVILLREEQERKKQQEQQQQKQERQQEQGGSGSNKNQENPEKSENEQQGSGSDGEQGEESEDESGEGGEEKDKAGDGNEDGSDDTSDDSEADEAGEDGPYGDEQGSECDPDSAEDDGDNDPNGAESDGDDGQNGAEQSGDGESGSSEDNSWEHKEQFGMSGDVIPAPKEDGAKDEFDWNAKIRVAAQMAKSRGFSAEWFEQYIGNLGEPKHSADAMLDIFLDKVSANDYSFSFPNKRYIDQDLYLPSLRDEDFGEIVAMVDVSSSLCLGQIKEFLSKILLFCQQLRKELMVITVNTQVIDVFTVVSEDDFQRIRIGGGTDFRPGFVYLEEKSIIPDGIIYFTDGWCDDFPEKSPCDKVLWILDKENRCFAPPFGEIAIINQ